MIDLEIPQYSIYDYLGRGSITTLRPGVVKFTIAGIWYRKACPILGTLLSTRFGSPMAVLSGNKTLGIRGRYVQLGL